MSDFTKNKIYYAVRNESIYELKLIKSYFVKGDSNCWQPDTYEYIFIDNEKYVYDTNDRNQNFTIYNTHNKALRQIKKPFIDKCSNILNKELSIDECKQYVSDILDECDKKIKEVEFIKFEE